MITFESLDTQHSVGHKDAQHGDPTHRIDGGRKMGNLELNIETGQLRACRNLAIREEGVAERSGPAGIVRGPLRKGAGRLVGLLSNFFCHGRSFPLHRPTRGSTSRKLPLVLSVTGVPDTILIDAWSTMTVLPAGDERLIRITHDASGGGSSLNGGATVLVTASAEDTGGVTVSASAIMVNEGGTAECTIQLNTCPVANVTCVAGRRDALRGPEPFRDLPSPPHQQGI